MGTIGASVRRRADGQTRYADVDVTCRRCGATETVTFETRANPDLPAWYDPFSTTIAWVFELIGAGMARCGACDDPAAPWLWRRTGEQRARIRLAASEPALVIQKVERGKVAYEERHYRA